MSISLAPWMLPEGFFILRLLFFLLPSTCSLTLPFICCNLNESTEKAYLVLICKELLLGLKQPFNMQDERGERWRLGLLAVSSCRSSCCHCLAAIKDSSGGEVAALQTKITDGRSCLPYSGGLATIHEVQENLHYWGRLLFVCVRAYLNWIFVFGFYKLANEFNDKHIDFLRCLQDMLVLKWLLIKFSSTHPQFSAVLLQNKLLTTGGRAWMELTKKSLPAANPNKHGPFWKNTDYIIFCLQCTR